MTSTSDNNLSKLLGVSRRMVAQSDLDDLLRLILEEARELTGAERSTLYLIDGESGQLISYIAQEAEISEIRLPMGKGIAGHVASTGEVLNIPVAYESELFDKSWDEKTGFRTRAVLAVPMRDLREKVTGVVQVLNSDHDEFTEDDQRTLLLLASHAASAIVNLRLQEDLRQMFRSGVRALSESVDQRSPMTAGHSERMTYYAVQLGKHLGLSRKELETLEYATMLHDIGKIGIPDAILNKPGSFTDDEYDIMKSHVVRTKEILDKFYFTEEYRRIPDIASAHHERLDGSGYPDGIAGEDMNLSARILAFVDVYDALTSFDRPYRKAMTPEEAIDFFHEDGVGEQFDQRVIDMFVEKKIYKIERRHHIRVDLNLSVEFQILSRDREQGTASGKTRDVSGKGMLLVARDFVPSGSRLAMRVIVKDRILELFGRVLRVDAGDRKNRYELGVEFLDLSREAEESLQDYLIKMVG